MKAVIYARYSSDNQREESIEGQLRECMEYADYNDITVVDTYIDRALSAKTDNRPAFQQMIKDSSRRLFDLIIVWKLDRFARNRYDSAHYKALLKKNGVKVISAKETIAEGSEGILLESVLEGMAEYYSADLSEKVKRGMTENALKGLWNGGQVPFGYVINKEHKLEINPVTAPIVKEIFKMCYDGKTIKAIYYDLKDRNILRSNGKPLRYNAVRYILTNRTYIGEYNHSGIKIENGVPTIISEDLFNSVQIEIAKNAHAPARHTADDDYLLTTKLFCGRCGAMMVAQAGTSKTKKVHRYYACVRQKKHLCDKKMVSKTKLEDFIVHKTMTFLQDNDVIERLSELLFKLQYSESTMLPHLEEQLSDKEKEIENIVNAVQKGYATDTLLKRLGELEKQRNEINDSITKEKLKSPIFTQEHFKMALCNFRKIDITKQDGKRKIIDTFINSIFLYDDHLKIVYNGNGKEETITLDELESSTLFSQGAPSQYNPNQMLVTSEWFGFTFMLK
ncbi:MAG: recombinase family protein [Clostridia bacterium]|nr:recombinase family protein [Clostridia bacterium]